MVIAGKTYNNLLDIEMKKTILALCIMFLFASCTPQETKLATPLQQNNIANEHIQFVTDLQKGKPVYPDTLLQKWRMADASSSIPESADFDNLTHVKLFVAANPHRYEGYVIYGLYFFRKQEFDVAVAAYNRAEAIIQAQKIKDTVEYRKFYELSLVMLYRQQRNHDKVLALDTFEKLERLDFEFFSRVPELANVIALAAMDYYNTGRLEDAKRLVERTRGLKNIPVDVIEKLEWLYKKIDIEQDKSNIRSFLFTEAICA